MPARPVDVRRSARTSTATRSRRRSRRCARKGFGRLLVDGRAVAFDEVDPRGARGPRRRCRCRRSRAASTATSAAAADRFDRDRVPRRRRRGVRDRAADDGPTVPIVGTCSRERFECRPCGIAYETPQPRLFSFNNPFGACPTCHGFGNIIELDMDLVVPDPSKSINQGAIEPWSKPHYRAQLAELKRAAAKTGIRLDVPWAELTDEEKRFVVEGDGDGLRGHPRVLPLARAEEIQGARPRVPQPLSRLSDLSGLRRRAAAARGARRARRRPHDRSRCRR